jgi:hypothetical protein
LVGWEVGLGFDCNCNFDDKPSKLQFRTKQKIKNGFRKIGINLKMGGAELEQD